MHDDEKTKQNETTPGAVTATAVPAVAMRILRYLPLRRHQEYQQ